MGKDTADTGAGRREDQPVIRFSTTKNRMRAGVSWYDREGDGRQLTVARLKAYAKAAGLQGEVDEANITEAVRLLNKGKPANTLVLLRGRKPSLARPGRFKPALDISRPVVPGMVAGQVLPAEPALPGVDVLGRSVPPRRGASALPLLVEEADFQEDDRGMITARGHGLVRMDQGRIFLEPLVHLSEDESEACVDIHPLDAQDGPVTMERLHQVLEAAGVVEGVLPDELEQGLSRALDAGEMQPMVLAARGRPVRHGRDGVLHMLGESCGEVCHILSAQGLPDGPAMFSKARALEEIARILPPSLGDSGRSVRGEIIPARPGKPLRLRAGKGVHLDKDTNSFRALEDGLVSVQNGVISLSDLLVIPRSLVPLMGHVKPEESSARVEGTVSSGARITVRRSLQVLEAVEDADINAGGDVQVGGGVIMTGRGRIRAGGSVSAAFMSNARVWAGQDVVVGKYIVCTEPDAGLVEARGRILVTGSRGVIQGGRVVARRGIEAWSTGSELGVKTVLSLSVHNKVLERLDQVRRKLEARLDEACRELRTDRQGLAEVIARFEDSMNDRLQQTALKVGLVQRQLDIVLDRLSRETERDMQELAGSSIVIRGRAHPGTVIVMAGRKLALESPVDRSRFQWDQETRTIRVGML